MSGALGGSAGGTLGRNFSLVPRPLHSPDWFIFSNGRNLASAMSRVKLLSYLDFSSWGVFQSQSGVFLLSEPLLLPVI